MANFPAAAPPSRNPTVDDSLPGLFTIVLQKFLQGVDDMLPAEVIAYDRATNMAQVQPLISMVTTLNQIVDRSQVLSVPVLQLGGGGYVLNFPLEKGNLGWIKANDRDISTFKQFWRKVAPSTARKHNFADGIFIPSVLTGFTIADEDAGRVVLQRIDGSIKISIGDADVKITAPAVYCTGDVIADVGGRNISLLNHEHINGGGTGNSGPPDPP